MQCWRKTSHSASPHSTSPEATVSWYPARRAPIVFSRAEAENTTWDGFITWSKNFSMDVLASKSSEPSWSWLFSRLRRSNISADKNICCWRSDMSIWATLSEFCKSGKNALQGELAHPTTLGTSCWFRRFTLPVRPVCWAVSWADDGFTTFLGLPFGFGLGRCTACSTCSTALGSLTKEAPAVAQPLSPFGEGPLSLAESWIIVLQPIQLHTWGWIHRLSLAQGCYKRISLK